VAWLLLAAFIQVTVRIGSKKAEQKDLKISAVCSEKPVKSWGSGRKGF
jgi:hypothetical protein